MGKGSNTTTTQSSSFGSSSPDQNAYNAYLALLNRSAGVAATPYEANPNEEVAPINAQQQQGIAGINQGANFIAGQEQPLSAADIQRYQDPYTNQVINATQADFDVQNQRALSNTSGNAASIGALGGDREAVARALTQESQSRTQAPIIAGLRSQGYQNAVNTAAGQQQQMLRAGIAAQGAAGQQVAAGTLEQQTQQAKDTQDRMDYYQKQGYPFQVAQWLAAIDTGVGSQMGGTSSSFGTTTKQGPTPNAFSQIAGLGLAGAGMFLDRGGRVSGVHHMADGGGIDDDDLPGFAGGGMPWSEGPSWVPQVGGITGGKGAPAAPAFVAAGGDDKQPGLSKDQMKGIGAIGKKIGGLFDDTSGGSFDNPLAGLSGTAAENYDPAGPDVFHRGGGVRRYANGGFAFGGMPDDDDATFDERFAAAYPRSRTVAGVGAARPAFANDDDVVNPTEPFRMLDRPAAGAEPPALEGWRGNVDHDRSLGLTAPETEERPVPEEKRPGLPPIITAGRSRPPAEAEEEPSEAMGYAGRPRTAGIAAAPATAPEGAPDQSFLSRLGIRMTPELKAGLLQAGLGLMASRHGGPGSFLSNLGEAGTMGVGAYNQTIQAAQEQAEKERKEAFEREKFNRPYQEMTAAQKAADARARETEKKQWTLIPGDGISTPDRLFNNVTSEIKDVPAGKGAEALTKVEAGQFNYGKGGPHLEKGDPVPEPVAVAGRSPDTLKSDAATYASTGILPKSPVSPKTPAGIQAQLYQNAVKNYAIAAGLAKGLTPEAMADLRRFGVGAAKFPLSRQGDQTVALGTAIRHLDSLKTYAEAWDAAKGNVNAPILRQAAARFATAWGSDAPTNLEQAARIAGPEIIKAIGVAGAGTGGERISQEQGFQPGASTQQILGSVKVAQDFLAGQLPAKEAQARNVGFPHERFIDMVGPKQYDYLQAVRGGHGESGQSNKTETKAAPAAGEKRDGWTFKGGDPSKKENWTKD